MFYFLRLKCTHVSYFSLCDQKYSTQILNTLVIDYFEPLPTHDARITCEKQGKSWSTVDLFSDVGYKIVLSSNRQAPELENLVHLQHQVTGATLPVSEFCVWTAISKYPNIRGKACIGKDTSGCDGRKPCLRSVSKYKRM